VGVVGGVVGVVIAWWWWVLRFAFNLQSANEFSYIGYEDVKILSLWG